MRSIMRYMLFLQHQKPGVPAKRQDLITIIMKGYRGSAKMKKLGGLIIKKAQAEFVKICGMEMKEVTPQLHSRQGTDHRHCKRNPMSARSFLPLRSHSLPFPARHQTRK